MSRTIAQAADAQPIDLYSLPVHPAAEVYRILPDDELQAMADDIAENGLRQKLVIVEYNGRDHLVDGRNRIAAARLANVDPARIKFVRLDPITDVEAYVVSANRYRRHSTKSQHAIAYAKLYPEPEAGGRGHKRKNPLPSNLFSEGLLSQARTVLREDPALAESVVLGDLSVRDAHERLLAKQAQARREAAKPAPPPPSPEPPPETKPETKPKPEPEVKQPEPEKRDDSTKLPPGFADTFRTFAEAERNTLLNRLHDPRDRKIFEREFNKAVAKVRADADRQVERQVRAELENTDAVSALMYQLKLGARALKAHYEALEEQLHKKHARIPKADYALIRQCLAEDKLLAFFASLPGDEPEKMRKRYERAAVAVNSLEPYVEKKAKS